MVLLYSNKFRRDASKRTKWGPETWLRAFGRIARYEWQDRNTIVQPLRPFLRHDGTDHMPVKYGEWHKRKLLGGEFSSVLEAPGSSSIVRAADLFLSEPHGTCQDKPGFPEALSSEEKKRRPAESRVMREPGAAQRLSAQAGGLRLQPSSRAPCDRFHGPGRSLKPWTLEIFGESYLRSLR